MSRLTETQAGAFFGILASALIFILTAMALTSGAAPRPHAHIQTMELVDSGSSQPAAVNSR